MAATAACGRPRWAKLSPNVTDLVPIAAAARAGGAEAVTLVNTVLGMAIDPETGPTGSAPARRAGACPGPRSTPSPCGRSTTCTPPCPTCPSSGWAASPSGADAAELVLAGACAVQVGTATFADPRAPVRVLRELEAWAASHRPDLDPCQRGCRPRKGDHRMTTATAAPPEVRSSLAVALDLDDSVAALRLARELQPWFGVAKVGLELYSASGPDVVGALMDMGYQVFCDLKFHDIPTTVGRAARVVGALGRHLPQLPRPGRRRDALRRGRRVPRRGGQRRPARARSRSPSPCSRATTRPPAHILQKRVQAALEAGCSGIVCAAADVHEAKQYGPRLTAVVPGHPPRRHPRPRPGAGRHPGGGHRRRRRRPRDRPGRHRTPTIRPRRPRPPSPSRSPDSANSRTRHDGALGSGPCRSLLS